MTLIHPSDLQRIKEVDSIQGGHASKEAYDEIERGLFAIRSIELPIPLKATCDRTYTAVHTSGERPLNVIRWIIIHDEEADTARSAAQWFASMASQGSAHLAVDDNICYRCLKDDEIPWGAPGANYRGFHIEQAGYASWSSVIWKTKHRKTIQRCAFKAALHCKRFGIPPVWLSPRNLKDGMAGISDHASCTKAFGGDHTDPGPNYPRSMFMWFVRRYYRNLSE